MDTKIISINKIKPSLYTHEKEHISNLRHDSSMSGGNTQEMVFCPNKGCKFFVGAWDRGDFFQCCRNKKHKIKKEVLKDE